MQHGYFEQGENPQYDAKVAREAEQKRAQYAHVERKAAMEVRLAELKQSLPIVTAQIEEGKVKLQQFKDEIKELEKLLKSGSRSENMRLQEEARAAGEKTYMTGTPCKHGHYSRRYTSSGACCECDRIGWKDGKLKETGYT